LSKLYEANLSVKNNLLIIKIMLNSQIDFC